MKRNPAFVLSAEGLECIRNDLVLFHDLSVTVSSGEVLQVKGPNGCGKTSLLRILCGLAQPNEGAVYWNDRDIRDYNGEYVQHVSYVGHHNGIKVELTPAENLLTSNALSKTRNGATPEQALKQFGLYGYEDTPVRKLSSGQQRRVALSRLLLTHAPLWVLDEPFTSVDNAGRKFIANVLKAHMDEGGMLILVSHEPLHIPGSEIRELVL
jgi:heme exporter protein A